MPPPDSAHALRDEAAQDLEAMFDLTVVGLVRVRDRKIVHCNRHMEELFGYTLDEMIGQSTRIWYRSQEEFEVIGGSAYPDLAAGRIHNREQYFRRKDGSDFWGRIAGRALSPDTPFDCVLLIEDTSERKLADERLRRALHEQQLMFDNAAVGIMFVRDRIIQRCNQRCADIVGYAVDELVNHTTEHLFPDARSYRQFSEDMVTTIKLGGTYSGEFQLFRKDGSDFWIQATGRRIDEDEGTTSVIWIVEDADERHRAQLALERYGQTLESRVAERTAELASANLRLQAEIAERQRAESRIWHVANHDALTGLPNRALFQDRLGHALAQAQRRGTKVALVFVDIDRFKSINDTLGHALGDRLLKEVAARLQAVLRAEDTVARLGGDEFVVLLGDIESTGNLVDFTERMRCCLLPPIVLEGHALHVSASFGVSRFPDDAGDGAVLMRHADTAMYHAKAAGRNAVRVFVPEMNVAVSRFFEIESKLPQALEDGQFELYYQPVVDTGSGAVVAMEALIRWRRDGQLISPVDFIPVAEESGMILPIGTWALREACRQAVAWRDAGLGTLTMAVNLSARQFRQPDLARQVGEILEETGLAPSQLELEITESTLMNQADDTLATLRQLADMGIALAVDDFGTGYSSLNYLKRFPVHKLKVDQSFVRDICVDHDDAAIVGAIIDLSRNLGLVSQAEGVESAAQRDALHAAGCTYCQGYHFSRPLSAKAAERFLVEATQ
jgi:diguanylate cyclase (GGDEF)-like protein/PAS domain S-box-containing protein